MKIKRVNYSEMDDSIAKKAAVTAGALGATGAVTYGLSKYWKHRPDTAILADKLKSSSKLGKGLMGAGAVLGSYAAYKHYKNKKK